MHKSKQKTLIATALALMFGAPTIYAADGSFGVSMGADYTSGKYGGNTSTDILYVPFTGKYETNLYSLRLTVPYIRITGPGNVVGGINPIVIENEGSGRRRQGGGGFENNSVGGGGTARTTEDGLGDVIAAASVNVLDMQSQSLLIDLTGKVKFGTADERKGLGTGENDYSAQVDISKAIDRFSLFGSAGYRFIGDPPGINLRNIAYGSVGGSYKFTQSVSGGVVFDFAQATSSSSSPAREVTAFFSFKVTPVSKLQVYGLRGFSNGSPDYGVGVNYSYGF